MSDTAAPPPQSPPPSPPRSRRRRWEKPLALLLVAGVALYGLYAWHTHSLMQSTERLTALESRIEALETQTAASSSTDATDTLRPLLRPLKARLRAVEDQLSALPETVAAADDLPEHPAGEADIRLLAHALLAFSEAPRLASTARALADQAEDVPAIEEKPAEDAVSRLLSSLVTIQRRPAASPAREALLDAARLIKNGAYQEAAERLDHLETPDPAILSLKRTLAKQAETAAALRRLAAETDE